MEVGCWFLSSVDQTPQLIAGFSSSFLGWIWSCNRFPWWQDVSKTFQCGASKGHFPGALIAQIHITSTGFTWICASGGFTSFTLLEMYGGLVSHGGTPKSSKWLKPETHGDLGLKKPPIPNLPTSSSRSLFFKITIPHFSGPFKVNQPHPHWISTI